MYERTRIKVCGVTRAADAAAAIAAGVDAIGLVFYEPSPRCVDIDTAQAIAGAVPPFVDVVALFVDAPVDYVEAVLERVQPDLLQFHGEESATYCNRFGRSYIKAIRVREAVDLEAAAAGYPQARGLLLDSFTPGVAGGTGNTFDWDLIPAALRNSIVLAGGLNADNVGEAIAKVRPFAVDVSGGVESAKGIKDAAKIGRLVHSVRTADNITSGARN